MARRKKLETDLPDADQHSSKPATQLVDAEHTIKYRHPVPVPDVDLSDDPDPDDEMEDESEDETEDEVEEQPRRGRPKLSFREKLKRKLDASGIGGTADLKLRIDRLPYYDIDGRTGLNAEKEFIRIVSCQEQYILDEQYLDEVAKNYGPGTYWFTLRHGTSILRNWHKKISGAPVPTQPGESQQQPAPAAPLYPPQYPMQPPAPPDPFKEAERALSFLEKYKKVVGITSTPSENQRSEEEVIAAAVFKRPEVIENIIGAAVKRFSNVAGSAENDEPSWAAVGLETVKSGQLALAIESLGNVALRILDRVIPKGGMQNGQTQMGAPPLAQMPPTENGRTQPADSRTERPMGAAEIPPASAQIFPSGDVQPSPEEQLLGFVIQQCARNEAPEAVCDGIIEFADYIRETQPLYAGVINHRINLFANVPTEMALEFVRQLPGGAQIAELPHAAEWTARLQTLLKQTEDTEGQTE